MESPSRTQTKKSPTRRSPGRKMSPARKASPSRKASPGRKTSPKQINLKPKASPGRKSSPARKASPARSPSRRRKIIEVPSSENTVLLSAEKGEVSEKIFEKNDIIRRSRERSSSLMKSITESALSSITVRKSTRILAVKEEELKADTTEIEPEEKDIAAVLDSVEYREKPEHVEITEFGGKLGVIFWLLFSPVFLVMLHIYSKSLKEKSPPLQEASNWKNYFDIQATLLYLTFFGIQVCLALLPIGRLAIGLPDKMGCLKYRFNGFLSCVVSLILLGLLCYLQFSVTVMLDKLIQMLVFGQIFGLVISIILFIKGGKVPVAALNPHGNTGNKIYDFFMGREVNPRFGKFDVKMTLLKIGIIGAVVVNVLLVIKSVEVRHMYSPTLMFAAGMQLFYYLDYLWHEHCLLASFEVMYEGTGAMVVLGYAMLPFFSIITTKHILDHRVELPVAVLGVLCLLHTFGYVIYRASNNQKSEFRRNPLSPAVNYLETIPTTRGRKLLVSGWWGWIRHPNYLGDVLMQWAWGITCGMSHWLPYVVPVSTTLFIVHRIFRNEARCHLRYNSAWDVYCKRVPSRILPKVF